MSNVYAEQWRTLKALSHRAGSLLPVHRVETESGRFVTESFNRGLAEHIAESHNAWLAAGEPPKRIREVV